LHLWHLGLPILGDPTYLPQQIIGSQQTLPLGAPPLCLHSESITLTHPLTGGRVTYTAPPPDWGEGSA
jgi:23S rRNA-/tRNA-specific pseudouridylate synthase